MDSIASSSLANNYNDDEDTTLEESSWTMYLEGFNATNNNNIDDQERSSFSLDDPVSSVVKQHEEVVFGLPVNKRYSKSRKHRGGNLVDEDLEDTATSPVNSPKIYDLMDQFKKKLKQKDSMERRSGSSQVNYHLGKESDTTELKKRGLCLVPVSTVMNYLG